MDPGIVRGLHACNSTKEAVKIGIDSSLFAESSKGKHPSHRYALLCIH